MDPVLRERGGSIRLATADQDLVLLETGNVDVLTRDDGEALHCARGSTIITLCVGPAGTPSRSPVQLRHDGLMPYERHGYADISHTLEVFDRCPDCSPACPATH